MRQVFVLREKFAAANFYAAERTRTSTGLRPRGPEPRVYASFTTAAYFQNELIDCRCDFARF